MPSAPEEKDRHEVRISLSLSLSLPSLSLLPHREHSQQHVVVVDEEDELLLPVRELCGHPQDEVLHLLLQCGQTLSHPLVRLTLVDAHNGS